MFNIYFVLCKKLRVKQILGFKKTPNYIVNYIIMNQVEFLLSGEQNDVKFYLVMLPNDMRKNQLEIKNITVALKWVFVICQKYEVQTFRCELFELTTLVSLETNYFLQTLCLKYGYFSLKHQKKKDLDFGLWAVELDIKIMYVTLKSFFIFFDLTHFFEYFYWNVFDLQSCLSFRCTAKWFICMYIYFL